MSDTEPATGGTLTPEMIGPAMTELARRRRPPLIIGPNLARALREHHGFDATGHPDFLVHDPHALDALDIEIRPGTVTRMRLAAQCQRTMDAVLSGELRHE